MTAGVGGGPEGPRRATAERIVDFFDRRAADYEREYDLDTPAGYALRIRRRKVLELFDASARNVLDVGCGPAVMTEDLLARGCRFFGIDPSAQTIAIGRRRFGSHPDVRFFLGDAVRLPFADGFFDAVLCMGVIDSLRDGSTAVQELIRVLKVDGTLIMTGANLLSPYAWWKNFVYYPVLDLWHRVRARLGDPTLRASRVRRVPLRHLYSRRSAEKLVASKGGRVIAVVPSNFNVFLSPLDELMPRTALSVTRSMEEGGWRWPDWIAAGWILKAQKL